MSPNDLDEFMSDIEPALEDQVDRIIRAENDPMVRLALIRQRGEILREYVHATRRANLEHRLREAEARLKPRLVG
jgi:hypothetical protein